MRICYFGTYERDYPRNTLIIAGLRRAGFDVFECYAPLGKEARDRSDVHQNAKMLALLGNAVLANVDLALQYLRAPAHDAVVVGYPGQLDVPLAWLLARARGVPLVWNSLVSLSDTFCDDRALVSPGSIKGRLLRLLDTLACHGAQVVLVDTAEHARFFGDRFGLAQSRLRVVPVGADDRLFVPVPLRPRRPDEPCHILFVGKCIPLHGMDTILRAIALVRERPIRFTIIGSGQTKTEMVRLRDSLGLTQGTWLDWVPYEALPGHYASADVCLGIFGTSAKASRVVPNKVFQALAVGRPVITADTPAIRESFEPGVHLLACEPGSPQALAEAIVRLVDDPSLCERLAQAGHALFRERFSIAALGAVCESALTKVGASTPITDTGERTLPDRLRSVDDRLMLLRQMFAYENAARTIPAGSRVLDLGCGDGYGTSVLSRHGHTVVGVDVSASTIDHARARHPDAGCCFSHYDGYTIPFGDASFDAVVSFQVIEHVAHESIYLREVKRVLKPGGLFLVTTPNRSTRVSEGKRPWNRFHLREYSAPELRALLAPYFATVEIAALFGRPDVQAMEMARVRRARRVAAIDILRIRDRLPAQSAARLRRLVKSFLPPASGGAAAKPGADYGPDSFFLSSERIEKGLDLFGTCVTPS